MGYCKEIFMVLWRAKSCLSEHSLWQVSLILIDLPLIPLCTKCGPEAAAGGSVIDQLLSGLMKEVKDVFFVVY